MNSKTSKKEQETVNEKPKKKKNKRVIEAPQEDEQIPKKPKKNKKSKDPDKMKKHKKVHNDSMEVETDEFLEETHHSEDPVAGNSSEAASNWPTEDLAELFTRMEQCIPEKDTFAYSTRVEKLHWEEIAFKEYTAEECKAAWLLIQKRIRKFRMLSEVLADAKELISKPWTSLHNKALYKRHPDMPKRPLTLFMLFYVKKKDKILSKHPGLEITEVSKKISELYKKLSAEKKEKYHQMALKAKREYEEKLEEFYEKHPEYRKIPDKPIQQKPNDRSPKKPQKPLTPFGIYYREQLKTLESEDDLPAFKEKCKEDWKNMPEERKVIWIDWAIDEESKYNETVKSYASEHPNFSPALKLKTVLTKEEKSIKERVAGKPDKPPNNAYSLFSKLILQGDDIKQVHPKERMNVISSRWKSCSEEEKKQYKERADHLMEQYKLNFASYLETLPEDKRIEELQKNAPKRKAKSSADETEPKKKKKKKTVSEKEVSLSELLKREPKQPPKTPYDVFLMLYTGDDEPKKAWKALSNDEKKQYEIRVKKLQTAYMVEFEKFLKGLTKEQLTAFKNARQSFKDDSTTDEEGSDTSSDSSESDAASSSS